jgi:hypothetical protein
VRVAFTFALALAVAGCGAKSDSSPNPAIALRDSDALAVPPKPPAGEPVEHPSYKPWGRFPVGTSVTVRTITDSKKTAGHTETHIVYTLKEKGDDFVVVESQATTKYADGRTEKNPPASTRTPRMIALPPGIKREDWGKAEKGGETGAEKLKVLGRDFDTTWHKSKGSTDAGAFVQQVWSSDAMPGGLVKSVTEVKAVEETTTLEVVALAIP